MPPKADLIEPLDVREPPGRAMGKVAELWKPLESGKIMCTACGRYCKIGEGQVGLCGIRGVHDGKLWLYVYGRVITGHVDPIEKKPVMHYRPGSKIFSVATTGCNWLCHPAGTPILMADGDTRPVEDVRPGDALWSLADTGTVVHDIVTAAGSRRAGVFGARIEGLRAPLLGTAEHPVLTPRGWMPLARLSPEDHVLTASEGSPVYRPARASSLPRHEFEVHPDAMSAFTRLPAGALGVPPGLRWSRVLGVRPDSDRERVYSFECVPYHNYVAERTVVHNCRYCFLPGTKVFTSRGHEKIEDLYTSSTPTENPEVRLVEAQTALTHRGRWRPIRKAFEHFYSGTVVELRVRGLPLLECTADHHVFASVEGGELRKVRADRLRAGDRLSIPRVKTWAGSFPMTPPMKAFVGIADAAEKVERFIASGMSLLLSAERIQEAAATPDHFLVPVEEVRTKNYVGPVYNIEVEEDHSYTANFLAVANCQNFDISQRRKVEGIDVEPEDVVKMTLEQGCQGLAYTYNQPTIFIEFARDIGMAARKAGLINIFVSNGYDTPDVVNEFPKFLDCITVDFKGSGETEFVRKYIGIPNADPIWDTLQRTRDTKKVHIEITDLIVPQVGDSLDAARKLSKFVHDELGPDTPIHFLRFHPDYKMMEFPWTPVETLEKHCAVAKEEGLRYVYIGNVTGHELEHTYCPGCGAIAVRRYGFDITGWYLDKHNKCKKCGYQLPIVGSLERTFKDDRFYSVLHHR